MNIGGEVSCWQQKIETATDSYIINEEVGINLVFMGIPENFFCTL